MGCDPLDSSNVYVFMNSARTIVRLIHYERGFYVMYEKRPGSGPVFSRAITDCNYLMIDETCELVGVVDPATNIPVYMRKYLWAFHDKQSGLVWYL